MFCTVPKKWHVEWSKLCNFVTVLSNVHSSLWREVFRDWFRQRLEKKKWKQLESWKKLIQWCRLSRVICHQNVFCWTGQINSSKLVNVDSWKIVWKVEITKWIYLFHFRCKMKILQFFGGPKNLKKDGDLKLRENVLWAILPRKIEKNDFFSFCLNRNRKKVSDAIYTAKNPNFKE